MDQRTQFLLQLLQKLGSPLMQAVNSHPAPDGEGQDASTISSLLSESVKISIALSQAMNLKTDDGDADAIRVALAALAGNLVADSYKQTGRVPGDADSRRMTKALEAVIVFADNFAPAAEHAQRLSTLESAPPFFDPVQTSLYAIHALVPAITAIAEFAFGQQDTRLIQDVSDRLGARAKALKETFSADGNAMNELVILQALGQIYASGHRAETLRLRGLGSDAQSTASLDPVWAAFDKQVSMLEVLLGAMTGTDINASGRGGGGKKPDVNVAEQEGAPSTAEQAPPRAAPPPGGSPMGFFKKK